MLCKSRTQRELVTDTSQLSESGAWRSQELGGKRKRGALKDAEVLGSVGSRAARAARGGKAADREVGKARSYIKGMQRFKLLLEVLWDAESIGKALPSYCRSR